MVAKQIRRELSDMLLTDKVLQYAVLPEAALGADRYLSSLTTISDVEVSADLQVNDLTHFTLIMLIPFSRNVQLSKQIVLELSCRNWIKRRRGINDLMECSKPNLYLHLILNVSPFTNCDSMCSILDA